MTSAMKNTTLIQTDELERVLLETTPRKAVQRAVDVIAQSIPSASVTVMDVGTGRRLHFVAANGISWSVLRKAEVNFNQELPNNVEEIIRGREICFIEDIGSYADWRGPAGDLVSYIGFPIIIDRRVVSIITFRHRAPLKSGDVDAMRPLVHLIALIHCPLNLREQQSAKRENFLALLHETTLDGVRATSAIDYINKGR